MDMKKSTIITRQDRAEFVGQIIDIFEDFLTEKAPPIYPGSTDVAIWIHNPERIEAIKYAEDPIEVAIIYGSDYGDIQTRLESLLLNWGIISEEA